jgi:hypothetical protein
MIFWSPEPVAVFLYSAPNSTIEDLIVQPQLALIRTVVAHWSMKQQQKCTPINYTSFGRSVIFNSD